MPQKFLITGLPRSRTAWWTALCNTLPEVVCFHEPCSTAPSWEQSLDVWATPGYDFVGIADSSLGFHLKEILGVHKPRTLVVRRQIADVEKALSDINIRSPGYCQILNERIVESYEYRYGSQVRWVSYERLDSYDEVKDILLWMFPGVTIDLVKVRQFLDLNIQVSRASVEKKLRNCKANIQDLLGHDVVEELAAWRTLNS